LRHYGKVTLINNLAIEEGGVLEEFRSSGRP
jgi:hypothetical protein